MVIMHSSRNIACQTLHVGIIRLCCPPSLADPITPLVSSLLPPYIYHSNNQETYREPTKNKIIKENQLLYYLCPFINLTKVYYYHLYILKAKG